MNDSSPRNIPYHVLGPNQVYQVYLLGGMDEAIYAVMRYAWVQGEPGYEFICFEPAEDRNVDYNDAWADEYETEWAARYVCI